MSDFGSQIDNMFHPLCSILNLAYTTEVFSPVFCVFFYFLYAIFTHFSILMSTKNLQKCEVFCVLSYNIWGYSEVPQKNLTAPAKEISRVSTTQINIEACPVLGQGDFHVNYAFWHVEQAYLEIPALSYFRTVKLWTLIKKKPWRIVFWTLLLCPGTNESRRIAEFWQCSQGALSAPVIIFLPLKHSFCLPSLSPECSNCLFIHCSYEEAVFP